MSDSQQVTTEAPASQSSENQFQRIQTIAINQWQRLTGMLIKLGDSRFGSIFSLDLRSLALFRICLGIVLILDLAGRIPNFRAHFSEEGVLPRELLISRMSEWRWSLFLINSSVEFQQILFMLTWVAAVLIILGVRTRLMLFIAWVLIMSLQTRNPMILSGADTLLRLTLFWAMLLPLGAVWSLDSLRDPDKRPTTNRFVSFASAGLMIQIAVMYIFTVLLKDGPSWRGDGTALFYATGAGQISKPFGEWLHQFPDFLKVMTHLGYGVEIIGPLLIFIPFAKGMFRIVGVAAVISLHVGIFLIMDVALFPWTSSMVMFAFLPPAFWVWCGALYGKFASWLSRRAELPRSERVLPGLPTLSPATSAAGGQEFPQASGARPQPSAAIIRRLASVIRPVVEKDRQSESSSPQPERQVRSSWWLNAFAAFCIVFVVAWNVPSVSSSYTMPRESQPIAYSLGLYQKWNMFAPNPPNSTVWYVVRGYVQGGEAVDLLTPFVYDDIETARAFTWDEPDNIVSGYYKDKYWRKYISAIALDSYERERDAFAGYVCRNWNAYYGGDARLKTVQFVSVRVPTNLDGTDGEEQRKLIEQYTCA